MAAQPGYVPVPTTPTPGWTIDTYRDLRERDNRERSTLSRDARPATTRSASPPR